MAMSGSGMAEAIATALQSAGKLQGLSPAQIVAYKNDMAIVYNAMVGYIVANMEISGIQVSDPLSTVETFIAGAGSNGGTLNAPPYPVTGSVIKPAQTLSQNNPGVGRVS